MKHIIIFFKNILAFIVLIVIFKQNYPNKDIRIVLNYFFTFCKKWDKYLIIDIDTLKYHKIKKPWKYTYFLGRLEWFLIKSVYIGPINNSYDNLFLQKNKNIGKDYIYIDTEKRIDKDIFKNLKNGNQIYNIFLNDKRLKKLDRILN